MADYNRVILLGRLTRDVELKYTASGLAVTDIGMAVTDRRKNQAGEMVDETTFVDVTLWGRTAEVASEYLSKGSPVFIEGRLKLDMWETEGQKRSKLRVVGERLQLLPKGGGGGGGPPRGAAHDESEYSRASYTDSTSSEPPASAGNRASGESPPRDAGGEEIPF